MTKTTPIDQGDLVLFNARLFGEGHPYAGTPTTLSGTVMRPVWGAARNVSIGTPEGRTYVRLEVAVTRFTYTEVREYLHQHGGRAAIDKYGREFVSAAMLPEE